MFLMTKIENKYKAIILANLLLSGFHGFSYLLLLAFQKNCEFCLDILGPALFFSLFSLIAYLSLNRKIFFRKDLKKILIAINIVGFLISAYYFVFYFLMLG